MRTDKSMPVGIENKFRSGWPLNQADRDELERIIVSSDDISVLESLIYIYCRTFTYSNDIEKVIDRYVFQQPTPGLTAVCLKSATIFWNIKEKYLSAIEGYIDYSLYDDWYDEVVFCANFFRDEQEWSSASINSKLDRLVDNATAAGDTDLIHTLRPFSAS
jgi:hypothetical protein